MISNLDRWKLYNRDSFSPDHFIEWSWYSLIGACLQRRVFYDNDVNPLFPCQYILLVAPAGVGKGLQIDKAGEFIKHHKKEAQKIQKSPAQLAAERLNGTFRGEDYLFPLAADSTTFESLLVDMVEATENFVRANGEPYIHASLYFLLDEFTSIFKLHSEDLITFLLTAWNGKEYTRKTKHRGHNHLKNPCVNILGGTTPSEFAKILKREIIGSGILGRVLMVYGTRNRARGIKIPAPDKEQLQAKQEILTHIKTLKTIYQCVKFTDEAEQYLLKRYMDERGWRLNSSVKLDEFYVRKLNHVQKLAMVMHFSDPGFEAPVSLDTVKRAIEAIERLEPFMHLPLQGGGRNELSPVANKVHDYVRRYPEGVGFQKIFIQVFDDCTHDELNQVLLALISQGLILYNPATQMYTSKV